MTNFAIPPAPSYLAVDILLRYGRLIAAIVGILPLAAAVWLVIAGAPVGFAVAAVVAAPLLYLLMLSYVELVAIIADMLLPK